VDNEHKRLLPPKEANRNQVRSGSSLLTLPMKSGSLQCAQALAVARKSAPRQPGAEILSYQDRDALIDPQDIRVITVGGRMEGVRNAIAPSGLLSPFRAHGAQNFLPIRLFYPIAEPDPAKNFAPPCIGLERLCVTWLESRSLPAR
jgi:hypothetical protein